MKILKNNPLNSCNPCSKPFFSGCLFLILLIPFSSIKAQNNYQLLNPGFEQWDGGYTSEPTHWNTFESSDGTYASLASDNHHYRRPGHRPQGSGSYYLTIYTKSIMGIKANGNMITGRVHAGAMSAASSNNYNYTQRSNSNHCQPFTATPDSIYVWVSFYAGSPDSRAQIEAVIHGNNDFKSPNDLDNTSLYKGRALMQTTRTTSSASQMNWVQLKVPFIYSGSSDAAYILVSMTTNYLPGEGDKNDSLSIDDIEFIYSAWLNDISFDGTQLPGFRKNKLDYFIHLDDFSRFNTEVLSCTTEAGDAVVEKSLTAIDDTTKCITLTVTAEDNITKKIYTVTATVGTPDVPESVNAPIINDIKITPNPASDRISIDAWGTLRLIDLRGRTVLTRQCHGAESINVSMLRHGTYIAIVGNTPIGKVIIQ